MSTATSSTIIRPVNLDTVPHADQMTCQKCKGLLRNPLDFPCPTCLLCEECAHVLVLHDGVPTRYTCLCEQKTRCDKGQYNRKITAVIDHTFPDIPCPHEDKVGCKFRGTVTQLLNHKCERLLCTNACGQHMHQAELKKHLSDECANREVTCISCQETYKASQVEEHWGKDNAVKQDLTKGCLHVDYCNACKIKLPKAAREKHWEEECPFAVISCLDCSADVLRKQMDYHVKQSETCRAIRHEKMEKDLKKLIIEKEKLAKELEEYKSEKEKLVKERDTIKAQCPMSILPRDDPLDFSEIECASWGTATPSIGQQVIVRHVLNSTYWINRDKNAWSNIDGRYYASGVVVGKMPDMKSECVIRLRNTEPFYALISFQSDIALRS